MKLIEKSVNCRISNEIICKNEVIEGKYIFNWHELYISIDLIGKNELAKTKCDCKINMK